MTLDRLANRKRVRIIDMAKLWQRSADPKTKLPIAEVDLKHFKISKPSVIFLSGIFTTDKRHAAIAEGLGEIENLLSHRRELAAQPDIYALSHKDLGNIFNIAAYNGHPEKAHSKAAAKMAAAILLPLVLKKGKPLDEDAARANLRNVTFVAYSAGTVFAQEMYNAALGQMVEAGYKKKTAKAVLNEVVLISMAAVSRPLEEKERFTTLYLAAGNDLAVRLKNRIWRPLLDIFPVDLRDLKIRPLSRTSLLITAYIPKKMWHWQEQPDGTKTKADIAPLVPPRFRIASNHEIPHYTTRDDEHSAFSKLVLNTVINAVNRRAGADVFGLLSPVTARDAGEAEAYRLKLDRALDNSPLAEAFRRPARDMRAKADTKPKNANLPKMKKSA